MDQGRKFIVLQSAGLKYVNSSGLGALIKMATEVQGEGGKNLVLRSRQIPRLLTAAQARARGGGADSASRRRNGQDARPILRRGVHKMAE